MVALGSPHLLTFLENSCSCLTTIALVFLEQNRNANDQFVVQNVNFVWLSGLLTDELRSFLELNLPKVKEGKKAKFSLGVADPKIGSQIAEVTKIPCQSNEFVGELLRGVRLHFDRFMKDLKVSIFSGLVSVSACRIPLCPGYIF